MSNRLFRSPAQRPQAISWRTSLLLVGIAGCVLVCAPRAVAGDAPQWMHAVVNAPLPAHDEKTDAVLLYSEKGVTVQSADKIRTRVREAYKILRPEGREHGNVFVYFHSPAQKVTSLHGWCIPAQGKDYEVKEKDAVDVAPQVAGGELIDDIKARVLRIPAPDPGNIIGYEYEVEEQPLALEDTWYFQETEPVRESHYSVQLPAGWEYKVTWLNYSEVKPIQAGTNHWQWSVADVKEIRIEPDMPPVAGVAGQMIISFFPTGGAKASNTFSNWQDMGSWYWNLTSGRRDPSIEIKQQAAALTASATSPLQKMTALAQMVQHDIRYVAIELGIGGWQPHSAPDVFSHRYGDCKDKATLMSTLLHEVGVESYYVLINTRRGSITPSMPAHTHFNHAILAIKLPEGLSDPSLVATMQLPKLGRVLFFDPTNELMPFGQISGDLQANYGLLVTQEGGELVQLPQQPSALNSIRRTAKLTVDPAGMLQGDVQEVRMGDRASAERWRMRTVTRDTDRIKPIETLLADSLSSFQITHATIVNLQQTDQPLGLNYSFQSNNYAKNAGNLLLIRPCVLGNKGSGLLEAKDPRQFPVEFDEVLRDTDTFEIAIPAGYEVDDVPPPVDADYSFASYHSKTEASGKVIRYTRTFEVKELTVPVERSGELKKFYRSIAGDQRNTVVLKSGQK